MRADFCDLCTGSTWVEDMGRQDSLRLIERKIHVDTDAQETSRASKNRYCVIISIAHSLIFPFLVLNVWICFLYIIFVGSGPQVATF